MASNDYFFMQMNLRGEKQSFQPYQPGVRSPKARLAAFLTPPSGNIKQSSSQIFVVSRWGDALSTLHNACITNENLREVRFDFWSESSISPRADFSLSLSGANVINKRIYWSYDDESPKERGAKFLDPTLDRAPNYWTGFGFQFSSVTKNGLIPAPLHPLLSFPDKF